MTCANSSLNKDGHVETFFDEGACTKTPLRGDKYVETFVDNGISCGESSLSRGKHTQTSIVEFHAPSIHQVKMSMPRLLKDQAIIRKHHESSLHPASKGEQIETSFGLHLALSLDQTKANMLRVL